MMAWKLIEVARGEFKVGSSMVLGMNEFEQHRIAVENMPSSLGKNAPANATTPALNSALQSRKFSHLLLTHFWTRLLSPCECLLSARGSLPLVPEEIFGPSAGAHSNFFGALHGVVFLTRGRHIILTLTYINVVCSFRQHFWKRSPPHLVSVRCIGPVGSGRCRLPSLRLLHSPCTLYLVAGEFR
jgi:hypothetical protein